MAERTTWNMSKTVAASLAGLSVLLLMVPWVWLAPLPGMASIGDGGYTLILSCVILATAALLWREYASLKTTVVLLTLGLFLVFAGTLAQTRLGIWDVINNWFRYRVIDIHFELFTAPFDKAKHNTELSG